MDVKHILLPVDLSESARFASYHAAGLAKKFGARVTILHVDEISSYDVGGDELFEYMSNIKDARVGWLVKVAEMLDANGIEHEEKAVVGVSHSQILEFTENEDVDLVVLGRHGAAGMRRFILGSTTKKVVRKAKVPVMVVPFDEDENTMPTAPVEFGNCLTTTDFSEDSQWGLRATLELAESLDLDVRLLHVEEVPLIASIPGEPPYYLPKETLEALAAESAELLSDSIKGLQDAGRLTSEATASTSVAGAIIDATEDKETDLVVVPSHGKGRLEAMLLGSTTLRLLRLSHVPLLVLPHEFLQERYS